jgi:hypothetical protein
MEADFGGLVAAAVLTVDLVPVQRRRKQRRTQIQIYRLIEMGEL